MIIVTTFGSDRWYDIGSMTAEDHGARHHHVFTDVVRSLGAARNEAVERFNPTGWITFLDAGDDLEPGYFEAMEPYLGLVRDLLVPKLRLGDDEPEDLVVKRDIINGMNPCCIGTTIHRRTFDDVGGFWHEPAYEDWSLFRRAVLTGSKLIRTDAVYHAPLSPGGRNSTVHNPRRLCNQIVASHEEWMRTR